MPYAVRHIETDTLTAVNLRSTEAAERYLTEGCVVVTTPGRVSMPADGSRPTYTGVLAAAMERRVDTPTPAATVTAGSVARDATMGDASGWELAVPERRSHERTCTRCYLIKHCSLFEGDTCLDCTTEYVDFTASRAVTFGGGVGRVNA